ncbi:hypothetical protein VP01_1928g6 [Puccinia sorghi]|uniref:Uncharacterized protein n=1 Tax=Puccinia sorghi TaxID=27349 RepID=A0A0L6VCI7_9BASI|nr:hypothetical protein VP01_1928g6 [Puccinia sorghi]
MVRGGTSLSAKHILFRKSCQNLTGNLQPTPPTLPMKLVVYVNRLSPSPHHSPHLPPQPRQSQRHVMRTLFCLCPWMSLVLLNLWHWSTPRQMCQTLQLLNLQATKMPRCMMVPTCANQQAVPVGSVPENNAMQGVDSQNDIVEVIILAQRLADRIGLTAEGSGSQDPIESGQPLSNSESGAPQPEDTSNQSPGTSESTNAAPTAAPSQRVTIMINGAQPCLMICEKKCQISTSESTDRFEKNYPSQLFALKLPTSSAVVAKIKPGTLPRGGNRAPADPEIDPATFLAGLDPSLREAILLEQDDSFISTLPPNLLAEVDAMRDCVHRQRHAIQSGHPSLYVLDGTRLDTTSVGSCVKPHSQQC